MKRSIEETVLLQDLEIEPEDINYNYLNMINYSQKTTNMHLTSKNSTIDGNNNELLSWRGETVKKIPLKNKKIKLPKIPKLPLNQVKIRPLKHSLSLSQLKHTSSRYKKQPVKVQKIIQKSENTKIQKISIPKVNFNFQGLPKNKYIRCKSTERNRYYRIPGIPLKHTKQQPNRPLKVENQKIKKIKSSDFEKQCLLNELVSSKNSSRLMQKASIGTE